MMEQSFQRVYEKFKLQFFRRLFSQVREREGSLSAMEAFSVEVIHQLNAPTIGRFADFLGISQSNATYKVNNLIRKGYIVATGLVLCAYILWRLFFTLSFVSVSSTVFSILFFFLSNFFFIRS